MITNSTIAIPQLISRILVNVSNAINSSKSAVTNLLLQLKNVRNNTYDAAISAKANNTLPVLLAGSGDKLADDGKLLSKLYHVHSESPPTSKLAGKIALFNAKTPSPEPVIPPSSTLADSTLTPNAQTSSSISPDITSSTSSLGAPAVKPLVSNEIGSVTRVNSVENCKHIDDVEHMDNFELIDVECIDDFDCVDDFGEVDRQPDTTTLRTNPKAPESQTPPPRYPGPTADKTFYAEQVTRYIDGTLLHDVNHQGRAPWALRPLAAVCRWLGIHGVGQTNCVSCATAVADTLKQGVAYRAIPDLKGAKISEFEHFQDLGATLYPSPQQLFQRLVRDPKDINGILTIVRPKSWWRKLFSPVDGHACNIIKTGSVLHLVDSQKRIYVTLNMPVKNQANTVSGARSHTENHPVTRTGGSLTATPGAKALSATHPRTLYWAGSG